MACLLLYGQGGVLPVVKPSPGEGCPVDEGGDERVVVRVTIELAANELADIAVVEFIGIRVPLRVVDAVVSVKGVSAQPHPVITVIVVPELEVYGELEQ